MAHTPHRQLEEMASLATSWPVWLPCTLYQVSIIITSFQKNTKAHNYSNINQCILTWVPLTSLSGRAPSSDSWPLYSRSPYTYFIGMDHESVKSAPSPRHWLQTERRLGAEFLNVAPAMRTQYNDIWRIPWKMSASIDHLTHLTKIELIIQWGGKVWSCLNERDFSCGALDSLRR
jgi:hypothetical protein